MSSSPRLLLLLVAVGALLPALPAIQGAFVYDDLLLLRDNPHLDDWAHLASAWNEPFWQPIDPRWGGQVGFYRPLLTDLFLLAHKLGGGEPWAHHLLALLSHGLCALLLARIALRLGMPAVGALFAGLLFGWHGGHAEPLAWAAGYVDISSTLFSLLAVDAFLGWRARPGGTPWLSAVWLFLAMACKESAFGVVGLLIAIVLLRPCVHRRAPAARIGATAALLLPAALIYALRVRAFGDWGGGLFRPTTYTDLDLGAQLLLSLGLVAEHFRFLLWPAPHAPFHPLELAHFAPGASPPFHAVLGPALMGGALLILGSVVWLRKRSGATMLGLGLLMAGLLPVLKTGSLGQFPFEERFSYLMSAGFALGAAGLLIAVREAPSLTLRKLAPFAVLGILVLHVTNLTAAIPHWRGEVAFFRYAVERSPHASASHLGAGRLALDRAQRFDPGTRESWDSALEARAHFQNALDIDPDDWFVAAIDREQANVGYLHTFLLTGEPEVAAEGFQILLRHFSASAEGHAGLGAALGEIGQRLGAAGNEPEAQEKFRAAIAAFDRALALRGSLVTAHYGRALCRMWVGNGAKASGQDEEAREHYLLAAGGFARASELRPTLFEYARAHAEAEQAAGRLHFARRALERFLLQVPDHPDRVAIREAINQLP